MKKYRPGETVPMSCNYKPYNENGESLSEDKMYLSKGETFPPTQYEGGYYVMDMRED